MSLKTFKWGYLNKSPDTSGAKYSKRRAQSAFDVDSSLSTVD